MCKEKSKLNFLKLSGEEKDFFLKYWLPGLGEQIKQAGGIEKFIQNNQHLAPQLKKIIFENKDNITETAPKIFPELDLKKEELNESYKKQLKILDNIITPSNEENLSEHETHIMGEDKIDKSE